jgi:proprotein convertase subtilisin/kexin type 5
MAGYYESNVTIALTCPQGCLSCTGSTLCLSCVTGYYMQTNQLCKNTCPERFYPNTVTQACSGCPYDCLTCDSTGGCLSCSGTVDFRTLNSITKRCQPSLGYYESGVTISNQCPSSCSACTSLTVCSACTSGYYLRSDNLCYSFCLTGSFPQTTTASCSACPSGCLSCDS